MLDVVVFSPDGLTLASGSQDDTVRLWDATTGEHIKTLRGHYSYLISLAFSPDGTILASGSEDDSIRFMGCHHRCAHRKPYGNTKQAWKPWRSAQMARDSPAAVETIPFACGMSKHTKSSTPSPNTKMMSGRLRLVRMAGRSPVAGVTRFLSGMLPRLNVSKPSSSLSILRRSLKIRTRRKGDAPAENPANATSIVFSPDGAVLVSGSYDATIRLWDIATGKQLETLAGHTFFHHKCRCEP